MGSKVPYGVEKERSLTDAASSLWAALWQHTADPFDPRSAFADRRGALADLLPDALGGYGKVLAHGLDTLEECFSLNLLPAVLEELEKAKAAAAERSEAARSDVPVLAKIGGEEWQVSPRGAKGGVRYWLNSDWCAVKIRPGQSWGISVRYSSQALWEYDAEELRARALLWLGKVAAKLDGDQGESGRPGLPDSPLEQWCRLSEVHYAVDLESERLTDEMQPELWRAVVAPASVKAFGIGKVDHLTDAELVDLAAQALRDRPEEMAAALRAGVLPEDLSAYAAGGAMQTMTIGFRRPLEIQIYDKGREIREASGKEWMLDLWEGSGWQRPEDGSRPQHCWRTEVRVRGEWMRDRGVVTWLDWLERGQRLLVEALSSRRLTRPTADSNRSRWPAHELWQIVACVVGYCDQLAPLGRRFLDTAKQRAKQMLQQAIGNIRAAAVVLRGDYRFDDVHGLLYGSPDEEMTLLGIWQRDQEQEAKVTELIERYRYIPRAA